jgi:hypothetical protein
VACTSNSYQSWCPLTGAWGGSTEGEWGGSTEGEQGVLKVGGVHSALKVGGSALVGVSMDVVRVCRMGSIDCSSSDGG